MRFFKKAYYYILYHGPIQSFIYLVKLFYLCICRMTGYKRYSVKKVNGRYKMRLDLKDRGISKALYLYGTREGDQVYIARNNVKSGMKVLDIGANIGYYALLEADLAGSDGKVYAFEPHPVNFEMLKKNIELNNLSDRIELHRMGMSNRKGVMEFFVSEKSNLHTLNPEYFRTGSKQLIFNSSINIDVVDITKFLIGKRDIEFIRMDIEGHEVKVLDGISRALANLKTQPSILFETHFPRYDDKRHNMRGPLSRLFTLGYNTDTIVSNNESRNPLRILGYKPEKVIKTDGVYRGVYRKVDDKDAINCVCDIGGIRAIFLKNSKVSI